MYGRSNALLELGSRGSVFNTLMQNNMDVNTLRTNAILHKDEWIELDDRVYTIAQERLTLTKDLLDAGLEYNAGGIGTTKVEWQLQSDMTPASVNMEPDSEDNRDVVEFELASVPIPIIHKEFKLGLRQLEATRRMGSRIDLTNADVAARKVAEGMEDLVIRGYSKTFGQGIIYGVTTHPNRITGTATGPWTTIDNVYNTILNMLDVADAAHRYGPFNLYVSAGLAKNLYRYYDDGSGQTVEERLQNLGPINAVRVNDRLNPGDLVLVQMTSDTIDLAVAQPLIPVEWDEKGGMVTNYKIMCAMAPRIKPDANGELGIVHFTGAI